MGKVIGGREWQDVREKKGRGGWDGKMLEKRRGDGKML